MNFLEDKVFKIIFYLNDHDVLEFYEAIKVVVLREFHQNTLFMFREFSCFEVLKQLIVLDKLYQTLDKEMASLINVREGNKWFPPGKLGNFMVFFFGHTEKNLLGILMLLIRIIIQRLCLKCFCQMLSH